MENVCDRTSVPGLHLNLLIQFRVTRSPERLYSEHHSVSKCATAGGQDTRVQKILGQRKQQLNHHRTQDSCAKSCAAMARQWTKSVFLGNRLSTNREYTVHYHHLMERKGTTMRPVLVTGNLCAGNVSTTPVCRAGGSKCLSSDTVNRRRIEKCT